MCQDQMQAPQMSKDDKDSDHKAIRLETNNERDNGGNALALRN